MAAKLILLGDQRHEYELGAFDTMGRHPDNTIQVLDRIVSKEHARITRGPNGAHMIRDAGSLNGTYVNGERITERVLAEGDQIHMGNSAFQYVADPQTALAQTRAAKVTMMPGQVQSEVRGRIAASSQFLPATQVTNVDTLRQDYEKLRVAHELSQKLALGTNLDDLLQKIVDETFQLIRADRAVILMYDADTDQLTPSYIRQKRDEEIKLSGSILDEVKRTRQAVLCSDAMVDERFKAAKSIIMQGIRSTMCMPLLVADELVGVFHIDSQLATGAFTEKDLQLFSGIATQAAIAIQNYRLAVKIEKEASSRAQLSRLLSPNLVDQIVSGALDINQGGQRRDVTMLFADIRGFTSMSERHTPEQMVHTLNTYFEAMVDVLFRNGGTLDKYVGDEIIGLFGAPVDVPDSPLHAVRCALGMLKSLDEFNRQRAADGQEPLYIGIGLNSGPVIAGAIGSSQTLQYTVIGDHVNTAARLCSVAKAGEIIISQNTMNAVAPYIIAETREPVRVKGKAEALQIYAVTGLRDIQTPHVVAPQPTGRFRPT
jgi:adenylate cyclase